MPRKSTEKTPKESTEQHNHVIKLMRKVLKWLSKTSNVNKDEVDHMQETLEELAQKATNEEEPASKAMGKLTLDEVQKIFQLTKLTPENEQPDDKWNIKPLRGRQLQDPQAFHRFYHILCELPLLPSSILHLLICGPSTSPYLA